MFDSWISLMMQSLSRRILTSLHQASAQPRPSQYRVTGNDGRPRQVEKAVKLHRCSSMQRTCDVSRLVVQSSLLFAVLFSLTIWCVPAGKSYLFFLCMGVTGLDHLLDGRFATRRDLLSRTLSTAAWSPLHILQRVDSTAFVTPLISLLFFFSLAKNTQVHSKRLVNEMLPAA